MPAVSPSRISREYSSGFSWNFASATNVYWSQTTRPKIDAEKKIERYGIADGREEGHRGQRMRGSKR